MTSSKTIALLAAASFAASAAPTLTSAQPYDGRYAYDDCRDQRGSNALGGAIIGGIAGALIGHGVSGYHERGSGTAAGAVIGGTAGAAIGASSGCGHRRYYHRYHYYRPPVYDEG